MVNAPLTLPALALSCRLLKKYILAFASMSKMNFFKLAVAAFEGKLHQHFPHVVPAAAEAEVDARGSQPVGGQARVQLAAEGGELVHAEQMSAAERAQRVREFLPIAVFAVQGLGRFFLALEILEDAQTALPRQLLPGDVGERKQAAGGAHGQQGQQDNHEQPTFFHPGS